MVVLDMSVCNTLSSTVVKRQGGKGKGFRNNMLHCTAETAEQVLLEKVNKILTPYYY